VSPAVENEFPFYPVRQALNHLRCVIFGIIRRGFVTLEEAFSLREREIISLVGGGGKTTLMFALGRDLSRRRRGIVLTTTTKIWDPEPADEFAGLFSPRLEKVKEWIKENLDRYRYLLVAQEKLDGGKLQGVPPHWVPELFSIPGVSCIVIEADGAAGRPLKAPREGEPVLPAETTLLIPMAGIDVLGKPLQENYVFRSRIAAEILKEKEGAEVKEAMVARLLAATLNNRPRGARVVPFLNKVDLPGGMEKGRSLARTLLQSFPAEIEKVVLGQARETPIIREVVTCPPPR
jgi:probable selenium-dependent hydroxylase accessory protein YqeC